VICEYGDCLAWTNLDWLPVWLIVAAMVVTALVWFWAAHRGLSGLRMCAATAFGLWPGFLVIKLMAHFLAR
jgi:hypothetical protein